MKRLLTQRMHSKPLIAASIALLLSGCASVSLQQNENAANNEVSDFAGGKLKLATSAAERESNQNRASTILAKPLDQNDVVQLALLNSSTLQVLLARGLAESSDAAQSGRIANPIFNFERMVRGDELELGRALTFGILDLLTLPSRSRIAGRRIDEAQLRLAGRIVDNVTSVRQAWVRAIAAQQTLSYAVQVFDSAEASSELARRLEAVGNFNRITRAREQAFYADATTRLATAQHMATAAREDLVRMLGLSEAQAQELKLPERLPDLPKEALNPIEVGAAATKSRLDIRIAQNALDATMRAQGLNNLTSFTDIELTTRRITTFDNSVGSRALTRGFDVDVRLPIFDWGGMQRQEWNALSIAAANQLESTIRSASSSLRQNYSAYRTAYDIATHFRDEAVPLRKVIADENQLRYNGMLIGVFELLADSRDQIATVMAAINAGQQFWLADAALKATLMGRPATSLLSPLPAGTPAGGAPH